MATFASLKSAFCVNYLRISKIHSTGFSHKYAGKFPRLYFKPAEQGVGGAYYLMSRI